MKKHKQLLLSSSSPKFHGSPKAIFMWSVYCCCCCRYWDFFYSFILVPSPAEMVERGDSNNGRQGQEEPADEASDNGCFYSLAEGVHLIADPCPPRFIDAILPHPPHRKSY
jgi:hypothetical protein